MKKQLLILATAVLSLSFIACSSPTISFEKGNLETVNREIVSISDSKNALTLNNAKGSGMAIINNLSFEKGVIELELKGENTPGKSFVGVAFNIQNDSTYEAVYFRAFNFQSDEKERREHSVQYIHHPKYTWKFLRANNEGQFEADYPRQPSPEEWFGVRVKVDDKKVYVYDQETGTELLSIERLTTQVSNRIGLWTGYNSKGEFRNLTINKP